MAKQQFLSPNFTVGEAHKSAPFTNSNTFKITQRQEIYKSAPFHNPTPLTQRNAKSSNFNSNPSKGSNEHETPTPMSTSPHSTAYPSRYKCIGFLDVRLTETKPWKRRYFVLSNNFLFAGATPHSQKIEAILTLEGCAVDTSQSKQQKQMEFILFIKKKRYYFRAGSPKQFESWTKHLSEASKLKIKDIYRLLYTLGNGETQNTKVVAAKHRATGEDCAIKIIDKRMCDKKMLNTEIQILKKLNSPFIVNLYDIFETKKFLYMVMENCRGGELFDQIAALDGEPFGEKDCVTIMHQIVSGIKYMHSIGIVHRDLKPENILCVRPKSVKKVKIADFGISKIVNSTDQMKTFCGTLTYTAPEVLRGKGYTHAVDYWSIGVIMYILLVGYPPFWGETEAEISNSILKDNIEFDEDDWKDITPSLKKIVESLLDKNSKKRVSPDQILKVTWKISSQDTSFSPTKKQKFKKTVFARKMIRASMGVFEKSSKSLNSVYSKQIKNDKNKKNQMSIDDLQPQNKNTVEQRKQEAFKGRRGSMGTEQLFELKLPMNQRDSWFVQDEPKEKLLKNRVNSKK